MAGHSLVPMQAYAGQKGLEHHYARWFGHIEDDFRSASLTQLISTMIPAGQTVLDMGCGSGAPSAALLQKGCRVMSQDVSHEMVNMCERYLKRKDLQGYVWQGEIDDLGEECAVDVIVALDVLEQVYDDFYLPKKIRKFLKKDGRLILAVPALSWLYGQRDAQLGHYRGYDKMQLITLVEENGFVIDHLQFWNCIGVLPNWYAVKLRKRPWNEDFRYAGRSVLKKAFNNILRLWFSQVENKIVLFPLGLTLIVIAHPQ